MDETTDPEMRLILLAFAEDFRDPEWVPWIEHDIGSEIRIVWDDDGRGIVWHHPKCRPWMTLRFKPDPASTGHVLVAGSPEHTEQLTIGGSLLCPKGCGEHGFIRAGRWVPA